MSHILWYQLIPNKTLGFLPCVVRHKISIYLGYNDTANQQFQYNFSRSRLFWEFSNLLVLEKASFERRRKIWSDSRNGKLKKKKLKCICGNKMPTRCDRGFYCRSYCLLNMFRASLCPSPGAQEYYTVVAACGILCCGFQVAGLVWSWGFCVRFAGCCSILQTGPATWKPQHEIPQAATTV